MPTSTTPLNVKKGETFTYGWAVTVTNPVLAVDSTWTAQGQIRSTVDADEVLYELDVQVDDDGVVKFEIPHADSSAWTWDRAKYGVEIQNAEGNIRLRVAQGNVKASDELVR